LALSLSLAAPVVRADEFTDRINARYANVPANRQTEKLLFPLLAKMTPAPEAADAPLKAALLPASSASFPAAAEWAQAAPQVAVLEALKKMGAEKDYKTFYAITQGYGATATDPDMVEAKMYSELGDPPLLTGIELLYLPKLMNAFTLVQVEASRRANDGKVKEAMDVLIDGLMLARQLCDREFFAEQQPGYQMMTLHLMRLRDVAYQDMVSGAPKLTAENLRDYVEKLDERRLGIERLRLPRADKDGIDQLIGYVFDRPAAGEKEGKPSAARFASTLARLSTRGRPLRAFSESARWEALVPLHASEAATRSKNADVYGSWEKRWQMRFNDPALKLLADFDKLDKAQFAILDQFIGDLGVLFPLRTTLRVEAAGTRSALAVCGFKNLRGNFPATVTSVRPDFTRALDLDPLDQSKTRNFGYLVPGKINSTSNPLELNALPDLLGAKYRNFKLPIDDSTFVLFSVGPDGNSSNMRYATQMAQDDRGDYLIWPPLLTLTRKAEMDAGRIK
jgi:hypothetical protein